MLIKEYGTMNFGFNTSEFTDGMLVQVKIRPLATTKPKHDWSDCTEIFTGIIEQIDHRQISVADEHVFLNFTIDDVLDGKYYVERV